MALRSQGTEMNIGKSEHAGVQKPDSSSECPAGLSGSNEESGSPTGRATPDPLFFWSISCSLNSIIYAASAEQGIEKEVRCGLWTEPEENTQSPFLLLGELPFGGGGGNKQVEK